MEKTNDSAVLDIRATQAEREAIAEPLKKAAGKDAVKRQIAPLVQLFDDVRNAVYAMLPEDRQGDAPQTVFPVEQFNAVIGAYDQNSRYFHNLSHLLEMTHIDPTAYGRLAEAFDGRDSGLSAADISRLQKINLLAGLFHDEEYAHVDGKLSEAGKGLEAQGYVKKENGTYKIGDSFDPKHRDVAEMVLEVFNFDYGETLSPTPNPAVNPKGGMNEFLSALNAALVLSDAGLSKADVLGVVTSIEATVPFKDENRMRVLRDRLDALAAEDPSIFGKRDAEFEADKLAANAALLANQDVMGLTGGLRPGEAVTEDHVRGVLAGTDRLHTEEVPDLRVKETGHYEPKSLLTALFKQNALFNGVLADESRARVFHGIDIRSTGKHYPPEGALEQMEGMAREVTRHMRVIMKARTAAVGLVTAIAQSRGIDNGHIAELLKDLELNGKFQAVRDAEPFQKTRKDEPDLQKKEEKEEKIAFNILSTDREVGRHDTPRSLIASELIRHIGMKGISRMVGGAFPAPKDAPDKGSHVFPMIIKAKGAADAFLARAREANHGNGIVEAVEDAIDSRGKQTARIKKAQTFTAALPRDAWTPSVILAGGEGVEEPRARGR